MRVVAVVVLDRPPLNLFDETVFAGFEQVVAALTAAFELATRPTPDADRGMSGQPGTPVRARWNGPAARLTAVAGPT